MKYFTFDNIGFAFAIFAMTLVLVWLAGEIATMDSRYFELCAQYDNL